jgi:hypothetical protein
VMMRILVVNLDDDTCFGGGACSLWVARVVVCALAPRWPVRLFEPVLAGFPLSANSLGIN